MAFNLELPNEILTIVFQHLCRQDLVSCSRACCTWNDTVNELLYNTVSISTLPMFQLFIDSITDVQDHDQSCAQSTISKRQQLRQRVKVVKVIVAYNEYDELHNYATMLSRLASLTPNVHTSKLIMPILFSVAAGSSFDWSTLASQWPKLTSLSFRCAMLDMQNTTLNYNMSNISAVFNMLQHLDLTGCEEILYLTLPEQLNMPYLQTLMVDIHSTSDCQALKKILRTCQHSLHTLYIGVNSILQPLSVNLDDLQVGRTRLKVFKLLLWIDSEINITSFGENLDHLELWTYSAGYDYIQYDSLHQALINGNFKVLSLSGEAHFDQLPSILEGNKSTLHTLSLHFANAGTLIEHLMMNKVRLYGITTLRFEAYALKHSGVRSLAEIFPNVKFLALKSLEGSDSRSCITTALSHFQHLKAIDKITCQDMIDQSISTYPTCSIYEFHHKRLPS